MFYCCLLQQEAALSPAFHATKVNAPSCMTNCPIHFSNEPTADTEAI